MVEDFVPVEATTVVESVLVVVPGSAEQVGIVSVVVLPETVGAALASGREIELGVVEDGSAGIAVAEMLVVVV